MRIKVEYQPFLDEIVKQAAKIQKAITKVLADSNYREYAGRMQKGILADAENDHAIVELEKLNNSREMVMA